MLNVVTGADELTTIPVPAPTTQELVPTVAGPVDTGQETSTSEQQVVDTDDTVNPNIPVVEEVISTFIAKMTLQGEWHPDFNDPTSEMYKQLQHVLISFVSGLINQS